MIIADATVLIALAKIGHLKLLKELYSQVAVSPAVKREVVDKGKEVGATEVAYVEQALEERWLGVNRLTGKEKMLTGRLLERTGLGEGEAESLAIASFKKVRLLVDEKEARVIARAMGLEYLGTAGMLLEAFIRDVINREELENAVKDLSRVTWLSPEVVADILRRAKEVKK